MAVRALISASTPAISWILPNRSKAMARNSLWRTPRRRHWCATWAIPARYTSSCPCGSDGSLMSRAHALRFAALSEPVGHATGPAVWLERLVLTDFRNYRRAEISVDRRPVVLTGPNGAGKTNL